MGIGALSKEWQHHMQTCEVRGIHVSMRLPSLNSSIISRTLRLTITRPVSVDASRGVSRTLSCIYWASCRIRTSLRLLVATLSSDSSIGAACIVAR